jgi:hypothetical protein
MRRIVADSIRDPMMLDSLFCTVSVDTGLSLNLMTIAPVRRLKSRMWHRDASVSLVRSSAFWRVAWPASIRERMDADCNARGRAFLESRCRIVLRIVSVGSKLVGSETYGTLFSLQVSTSRVLGKERSGRQRRMPPVAVRSDEEVNGGWRTIHGGSEDCFPFVLWSGFPWDGGFDGE